MRLVRVPGRAALIERIARAVGPGRLRWLDSGDHALNGEGTSMNSMSLVELGPPPPDSTNLVADDARAAALGRRLFFDEIDQFWTPHWRFAETDDGYFDHPAQRLSKRGARKLYYANALKYLPSLRPSIEAQLAGGNAAQPTTPSNH